MQVNKSNTDDLDYLAQLGFEKISISDLDLKDLDSKIKKRVFSYNNGLYFGFISLIIGVFIGVSLFFMVANKPVIYSSNAPNKILNDTMPVKKPISETAILLDTVKVFKENFVNPRAAIKNSLDTASIAYNSIIDSVSMIPAKPINVESILDDKMNESKLKYISNAPVVYIHDLKVTNYTTLYFKKNQYVKLPANGALPVSFANKDDLNKNTNSLKQSADYYLHEEFSGALLLFKKGYYDQCVYALKNIAAYNDEDINCNFYSGMCYYYKKNYAKAIEFFDKCIESVNNTFLQEAMYYNAMALYESGDKETAISKFKVIADEGEFYSEKAKKYLKN
ncbi:MAG: tetratricopeptide repeat protein [Bacteroidetes bacterium]|nr:tetratricopeptide repeat protein [Bacteroidota bacterium]